MNNNNFKYSVLKYRHSILLNEILNVGLLFYFPTEKYIRFIFPNKLNRISRLYQKFNVGTIKIIQAAFEKKCTVINREWVEDGVNLFSQIFDKKAFSEIINEHFLTQDASSLYFDEIKTGTNVNIDIDAILIHYYKEYFSCYEDITSNYIKKDEKYIEQKLKNQLKNKSFNYHEIEINKEISVGLFSEKFKWGWKNGTQNLIAPIGFDLQEADTIKQKALSWYGKLSFLNEYAINNNISFHIITSKPADKNLFKSYDNALKVIEKANAPTELYDENEIEEYSNYISKNITGFIK